jgi:hypothetical protein
MARACSEGLGSARPYDALRGRGGKKAPAANDRKVGMTPGQSNAFFLFDTLQHWFAATV